MLIFQKKANIIFFQIAITVLVFVVALFYAFFSLYSQILLISGSALNSLESVCGCTNHFSFFNHPYLFTMIFFLGFLMTIYSGYILLKLFKLRRITVNFISRNLRKKKNLSKKLESVVRYTKLENRVTEIDSEKPVIFCYSFLRPKVCISSELVKKLTRKELTVVLLHEKMHIKNLEPLRLFFVKNLEKILFFLPWFKSLAKQYSVYSEMAADEFATNGFQNKSSLAGALCKVLELEKSLILENKSCAVSFFNVTDERINKLINDNYNPQYKLTEVKFLVNIVVLFIIAFSFFQVKNFDFALAETHEKDSCIQRQSVVEADCEIEGGVGKNYFIENIEIKFFE